MEVGACLFKAIVINRKRKKKKKGSLKENLSWLWEYKEH